VEFLKENTNQLYFSHKFKKKKAIEFANVISPGKGLISGPYLKSTPDSAKALAMTMFKYLRNYLQTGDPAAVIDIIRFLDGNLAALLPEFAVQVLIESNAVTPSSPTTHAWDLMMMLTYRYAFIDPIRSVLFSYFVAAASSNLDFNIQRRAVICILRLAAGPSSASPPVLKPDFSPRNYMIECSSMTRLYGVSLEEVLFKEEIHDLPRDPTFCVPGFVKMCFQKIIELKGTQTEGLFRVGGNSRTESEIVARVNVGLWEFPDTTIPDIASLTKRFFRDLQASLIPVSDVMKMNVIEPGHNCVALAMSLSNAHRDTLMYFVAFIQFLLRFESVTKMGVGNLITCLAPLFANLPPPTSLQEMTLNKTLERIAHGLITEWDTSDFVYWEGNDDGTDAVEFVAGKPARRRAAEPPEGT